MIIPLDRLTRNPACIRRSVEPLGWAEGQIEPIDVVADGMVLDGWRRVLAARAAGETRIVGRVWESEADYRQWLWLEVAAIQRRLNPPPGEPGQSV